MDKELRSALDKVKENHENEWDTLQNELTANDDEMEQLKNFIIEAIGKENEDNFQLCIQVNVMMEICNVKSRAGVQEQ